MVHRFGNDHVEQRGRTVMVELWYPTVGDNPCFVEVGLVDVRSADAIRVSFDHARNGWTIEQPTRSEWDADEAVDPRWKEVAFVDAWVSDKDRSGGL